MTHTTLTKDELLGERNHMWLPLERVVEKVLSNEAVELQYLASAAVHYIHKENGVILAENERKLGFPVT